MIAEKVLLAVVLELIILIPLGYRLKKNINKTNTLTDSGLINSVQHGQIHGNIKLSLIFCFTCLFLQVYIVYKSLSGFENPIAADDLLYKYAGHLTVFLTFFALYTIGIGALRLWKIETEK